MTHLTWSIETAGECCPKCKGATILVIAPETWRVDEEDVGEDEITSADVYEEITGHYCKACQRLVSLSLNTPI